MRKAGWNLSAGVPPIVLLGSLAIFYVLAITASAQEKAATAQAARNQKSPEQTAELNLQTAKQNPLQLRHFLLGMPKGGDLHNHLSGAVYAESWIRAAAEDHLCVDVAKLAFVKTAGAAESGVELDQVMKEGQ